MAHHLNLICWETLFQVIWKTTSQRWYICLWIIYTVPLVNFLLFTGFRDQDGHFPAVWRNTTMIYIAFLHFFLFLMPIMIVLDYVGKFDQHQIDVDFVVTLWLYIYWSAIVLQIMILPIYYIYHFVVLKNYGTLENPIDDTEIELTPIN